MWNFLEIAVGQIWVQEQFELLYNILLFTLSFTRCVYQFIRNGVSMLITHSLKGGCLTCITVDITAPCSDWSGLGSDNRDISVSGSHSCVTWNLHVAQLSGRTPHVSPTWTSLKSLTWDCEIVKAGSEIVRLWDFAIANVWVWSRDKQQCRQARGKTSPWNGSKWVLPSATKWRHLVWNFATRWRHHH